MQKILFVCMGNICRSPTAEAVFRSKLKAQGLDKRVSHDSCGTIGYHAGSKPDQRAMDTAQQRGYAMKDLRARQLCPEDYVSFDLILAMDKSNLNHMLEEAPPQYHSKIQLFLDYGQLGVKEVPDPYYGGPKGFERVLDLVENACDGLIDRLKNGSV